MRILAYFLLLLSLSGCVAADQSFTRVAPGVWRGVLALEHFSIPAKNKKEVTILYDQFKPGEVPFNFTVTYLTDEKFYIEIMNGKERIRLDSIQYGRDRALARDTMDVWFPEYQSYIHAEIRGNVMQGYWKLTTKENYQIPFYADSGRDYRFTPLKEPPTSDISGNWATLFGIEGKAEDQEEAVAEFQQQGNHLEGTFRTESGDYRYLEGTVQGHRFWLSCFDGAHAYLFSGAIQGDTLQGEFRSGTQFRTLWEAWKDPKFDLPSADSIAHIKPGHNIEFQVNTPEGGQLSYPSPAFDGKIKVFTIMGTWCPNCKDEMIFLRDYLKEHPDIAGDIKVVGFAFERGKDVAKATSHLLEYKKKLGIPFDIVYAGEPNKDTVLAFFPALDKLPGYPVMMVIDKQGQVREVHTGFDGPATSRYTAFKEDFDKLMREMK